MSEVLSKFSIYCRRERRYAEATCLGYERDVRACVEFLAAEDLDALKKLRARDLRRFLEHEETHRPSSSSRARAVAALRCFFRFCVESDYLERDPTSVLRSPKKRETLPDLLNHAELARLLSAPHDVAVWQRQHAGKRERDMLLLALFAYSGLRHAELLSLDWEDVNFERRLLRVRHGKGGRPRVLPIHPDLMPLFCAHPATRGPLADRRCSLASRDVACRARCLPTRSGRYARAAGVS